jgi:subtilisin family serine protease
MTTSLVSRVLRAAATVVVVLAAASSSAAGERARTLDAVLQARAHQLVGRSRVIVQFKDTPDVRAISDLRGDVGRRLPRLRAQVAEIDNSALAALATDPRVERVALDRAAFATMERTGAAIGATAARDDFEVTGRGIGVAVIDSGISGWHDDLYAPTPSSDANRVVHFRDFTDQGLPGVPSDPYGHGTHVAGIIAGNGFDSGGGRTGIAPGAHLVGLKVLDASGNGYISDVIAALDYAIAIKDVYNIRVINLSVGSAVTESYHTDPLALAAKRAVDAGIVVVAAAGNLGRGASGEVQFGGITAPGNAPWVLTVGASSHQGTVVRSDDAMATFSSRGPTWIDFSAKPDLVAPGVGIESLSDPFSTLYAKYPQLLLDGSVASWYRPYMSLSGTSMAAPVVAGTIALMLEANPKLTPNAVKGILEYTAQAWQADSPLASGAGLLNAHGALRLARYFANPASGFGPTGDRIAGEWIAWSQQVIWGNYRVSGGVPRPGANAWAAGQTWGAAAAANGSPIVWGAAGDGNIIWSTHASADGNIIWSTASATNVVWGLDCGGADCRGVIWGARPRNGGIWGTASEDANIIWSTHAADDGNIIWSTRTSDDGNIIWSTGAVDQTVWGTRVEPVRRPRHGSK